LLSTCRVDLNITVVAFWSFDSAFQ
jgi:hypothetical protein